MSTDLVHRFAQLVARPGTQATYIDPENKNAGYDSLDRASQSRRAYFVVVRDTILAIDCDLVNLVPVLEEIRALLIAEGLVPVIVLSGGEGRRHLFCLILDPRTMRAYKESVYRLGHGKNLEVRHTIRPPLSPHRLGLPVTLLHPEDPSEAIAALTPQRPRDLSAQWMEFLKHGAPQGQRSTKIQGCALAAVNANWTFGHYYWAMMDPQNRGGEKVQARPDAERYLERAWESAVARAKRNPPVQDRPEVIDLIARMRRRVETWPWPKRAGETYRRVLGAYLSIAERTSKLVFAASVREIAELGGVSIRAVVDANRWLQHERWLRRHRGYQRGTADAADWRVQFPSGSDRTEEQLRRHALVGPGPSTPAERPSRNNHPRGGCLGSVTPEPEVMAQETESVTGAPHDLWRPGGLGQGAGRIYRMLTKKKSSSEAELARRIGCHRQAVRRHLGQLGLHGLAVQDLQRVGWFLGDADLDAVAADLGVAGKGMAQREEYKRQRKLFRELLDGGGLGRGRNG